MRGARPYVLLYLALTLIYHSNLRPGAAGDSLSASLIPFAVLFDHSITLDRFGPWIQGHVWYASSVVKEAGGHWYSAYPIAGPVLAAPLYSPLLAAPSLSRMPPESLIAVARIAEKFAAVALAALAAVWMAALLGRLVPRRWAWILTWVFALGTSNWSISSQALWQHTFGTIALIGCWYTLERWESSGRTAGWAWWCGIAAGAAVMVRPTNAMLFAALAAALWAGRGRIRDYVAAFLPLTLLTGLLLVYNESVFGRVSGGYPDRFDGNILSGAAGLLLSPGRGLLIYTPIVFFVLAAFLPATRELRSRHRALLAACSVFAIGQIAVTAQWPVWWGGYCWGPRLLSEIVPGVMVLIAIGLPKLLAGQTGTVWRRAFVVTAVYCCLIQALGVYFYPKGRWDRLPVSVDAKSERLWNWKDNPIARTLAGGPAWEPYQIVGTALTEGLPAAEERLKSYGIAPY